jgi:hypothetical protein
VVAAILVFALASLLVRWLLTERVPFVMDELVDTQLGVQVGRGLRLYLDYPHERLPLLTALIGFLSDQRDGSFQIVLDVRKLMWAGSVLVIAGTFLVARQVIGSRLAPLALLLVTGFSTFLDRGIRVRADLVSTTLALPALILVCAPRLTGPGMFAAGLSLGLAFLTTQKAVYFVAAFAVALTGRHLLLGGLRRETALALLRHGALSASGFFLPLAFVVGWAHRTGRLEAMIDQCFFFAAYVGLSADTYRSTWIHLGQSAWLNPVFWLLALAGIALLLGLGWRRRNQSRPDGPEPLDLDPGPAVALGLWSVTLLGLILQHATKYPYVFINLTPCLGACGSVALARLLCGAPRAAFLRRRPGRVALRAVLGIALVAMPLFFHWKRFDDELLSIQKAVMDRVERITSPADHVFDGVGMAVTRPKATPYSMTKRWQQERDAGAPYRVIPWLLRNRPLVAIVSFRFDRLLPDERAFVDRHFVHDWAAVHVVGARAVHPGGPPTSHVLDLLATADYCLRAPDLSGLRLDGRPPRALERLTAGEHSLVVQGPPREIVFMLAAACAVPPPPPLDVEKLYPSYRD